MNPREDYQHQRAIAQAQANATGYDYGVEKLGREYNVFMLPQKRNRYGHERQCEVVMCDDMSKCQPGHGPEAKE